MELHRSVVEAVSWRLASTLVRRHPELTLFLMYPCGAMYDVLCLRSQRGAVIMLNRAGTIQVHGRHDDQPLRKEAVEWSEYLTADNPMAFVERIESQAGLPEAVLGPMSRPALIYKVIAALTSLGLLTEPFEVGQGFVNSDGQSGSYDASWWEVMKVLDPDLTAVRPTDIHGQAGHRFWKVERPDFQLTFETSTASMWPEVDDDDLARIDDDLFGGAKYREDLVDYASVEGFVGDEDASTTGPWAVPTGPWPSARDVALGADANHEFDPMLRLLQAVLEFGRREN